MMTNRFVHRPDFLRPVIERTKADIADLLTRQRGIDYAFLGNSSDLYAWVPTPTVDLDLFVLSDRLHATCGRILMLLAEQVSRSLPAEILFSLRIIEGPYKPVVSKVTTCSLTLHIALFSRASYERACPLKRYSWRKYRLEKRPYFFDQMSGNRPSVMDVLMSKKGALYRYGVIVAGICPMTEWLLPAVCEVTFVVTDRMLMFQEVISSYTLVVARYHGKSLERIEADQLSNTEYIDFYVPVIMNAPGLEELISLKMRARQEGARESIEKARLLAVSYFGQLFGSIKRKNLYLSVAERRKTNFGRSTVCAESNAGLGIKARSCAAAVCVH